MRKYIVKNCPAYFFDNVDNKCTSDDNVEQGTNCQDCTDCLIKRVIDKVMPKALIGGVCETSEEILDMFEIERVKECQK